MLYSVGELVGKGSYGSVHSGIKMSTKMPVALKFIDKSVVLKKPSHYERLRREVRILKLIKGQSPYLLSIEAVHETATHLIIVTELVKGGELISPIKSGSFKSELSARAIFGQLVSAIRILHQSGVIHRDIKPQNILISRDNSMDLKLIDFGFATIWDKHHPQRSFCGSPYYASPEMVNGTPYEGPEVDVWSLGVILYSMVSGGQLPFIDNTLKGLYSKIAIGRPESIQHEISYSLSDLISKMLEPDPSKRASIEEVALHPWLSFVPISSQIFPPYYGKMIQFPLSVKILSYVALLMQPTYSELSGSRTGRPTAAFVAYLAKQIELNPSGRAAKLYMILFQKENEAIVPDIVVTPSSSSSSKGSHEKKGIIKFLSDRLGIPSSLTQKKTPSIHLPKRQIFPLGSENFVLLPEETDLLPYPIETPPITQ